MKADQPFQEKVLAEIRHSYQNDAEAKQRMQLEYERYVSSSLQPVSDDSTQPLESTFWGWGSKTLPIPMKAFATETEKNGFASSRSVWGQEADKDFRIPAAEAEEFSAGTSSIKGSACGASPMNQCRWSSRFVWLPCLEFGVSSVWHFSRARGAGRLRMRWRRSA